MSAWLLDEGERETLGGVQQRRLRERVIGHACAKLVLPDDADRTRMRDVVAHSYDLAAMRLKRHPGASYASYVFLTLIYVMLGEQAMASPAPWQWLDNDRVVQIRVSGLPT